MVLVRLSDVPPNPPPTPAKRRLRQALERLSNAERNELAALFWLGRPGSTPGDFPNLLTLARRASPEERSRRTDYLMSKRPSVLAEYREGMRKEAVPQLRG